MSQNFREVFLHVISTGYWFPELRRHLGISLLVGCFAVISTFLLFYNLWNMGHSASQQFLHRLPIAEAENESKTNAEELASLEHPPKPTVTEVTANRLFRSERSPVLETFVNRAVHPKAIDEKADQEPDLPVPITVVQFELTTSLTPPRQNSAKPKFLFAGSPRSVDRNRLPNPVNPEQIDFIASGL